MDLKKIFLKDACPTKMGGQAVMEGIMMRGETKTALAIRLPNGEIRVETGDIKEQKKWMKLPLIRGVAAFVSSLVVGTGQLMKSAEILGEFEDEEYEEGRFEKWLNEKFGSKAAWNFMIYVSVAVALAFTVGVFIILPTGSCQPAEARDSQRVLAEFCRGRHAYTAVCAVRVGDIIYERY